MMECSGQEHDKIYLKISADICRRESNLSICDDESVNRIKLVDPYSP